MSNSLRGAVSFTADGKKYHIAMTTNAMVAYQDAADETLLHGLGELQKDPSDIRRVRRMVWAGLSHIPDMTEDKAGDIMDALGIIEAVTLLSEAANAAFLDAEKGAETGNARPVKSRKPTKT